MSAIRLSRQLACCAVGLALVAGTAAAQSIVRVSVDSSGAEANGDCPSVAISADGRFVAFDSVASNLVAGDTNGVGDVFVHDRTTGITERVSVDSYGVEANGDSGVGAISATDWSWPSRASPTNLVAGDTNGAGDIFVHDRPTGITERVSVDSSGGQARRATQVAANRRSRRTDDSSRSRASPTTSSPATRTVPGTSSSTIARRASPSASASTRRAPRRTATATRLQGGDLGGRAASSRSRATRRTSSPATRTMLATSSSTIGRRERPSASAWTRRVRRPPEHMDTLRAARGISADGTVVAFVSSADNLVAGDTNGESDVFVHDRVTGITERISVDSSGAESKLGGGFGAISADGTIVAFASTADEPRRRRHERTCRHLRP